MRLDKILGAVPASSAVLRKFSFLLVKKNLILSSGMKVILNVFCKTYTRVKN